MDTKTLTTLQGQARHLADEWFASLKIGDTVYNYSLKWQNKQIVDKKLREGVIKEIHNGGQYDRYVIVDNLTTGRQNKWGDYDLVKPENIQALQDRILELSASIVPEINPQPAVTTADQRAAQILYEQLIEAAEELLKDERVRSGKCSGIYGAFSKATGECIYIGKSRALMSTRWREHARFWKKLRPIHRQPLLTQYLHFFGDQIEWRVLLPVSSTVDNNLIEYAERRLFEKYKPIANTIVPNGTFFGRSVMEGEGEIVSVSDWNPNMVEIRMHRGQFNGFVDGKSHFKTNDQLHI